MRVQLSNLTDQQKAGLAAYSALSAEERVRYQEEATYEKWARTGWLDLEDVPKSVKTQFPKRYAGIEEFHEQAQFPKLSRDAKRKMSLILENQRQFQMGRTVEV